MTGPAHGNSSALVSEGEDGAGHMESEQVRAPHRPEVYEQELFRACVGRDRWCQHWDLQQFFHRGPCEHSSNFFTRAFESRIATQ